MVETLAQTWWMLALLGIFAGVLSGALGLGSGTLLIPVLVYILHFPQKTAQGMSLLSMIPIVIIGAWRYKMNPSIDIKLEYVAVIAITAVIGVLIGTHFAFMLPANVLRKIFAVYIILVGVRIILL